MKRILILLLVAIMVPVCANAQSGQKKSKKEVSPVIEGKQKVRRADYPDTIWKFCTFDARLKYYTTFDYSQIPAILSQRKPKWGSFTPVVNHLQTVARAPMRICAVYAVNPSITDEDEIAAIQSQAEAEAVEALHALTAWMTKMEMKNKVQINVAQIDYRYWQGTEYFFTEQTQDPLIHVGLVLYFGTKKIDLFPSPADGAKTFNDIKFFPNDATVQVSYDPMLDSIASFLRENDRLEVLLTGYSDNRGTEVYNTALSKQRCTEIKKALIKRGVSEYRIEIVPKGSADPLGDNDTYEGYIQNNRVAVKIQ